MKVFFTSSITGLRKFRKNCEIVSDILRKLGHQVQDHFLRISKQKDRKKTQTDSKHVFDYITKRIKESDVFIAEMSYRSAPVSYQLTYSLEQNKPSLYLYDSIKGNPVHAVYKGNPSKYLIIQSYDKGNIEEILKEFLKKSEKLLMRRFNFILPAKMDDYLRIRAAVENTSKGELLRGMIDDQMRSDDRLKDINEPYDAKEEKVKY